MLKISTVEECRLQLYLWELRVGFAMRTLFGGVVFSVLIVGIVALGGWN